MAVNNAAAALRFKPKSTRKYGLFCDIFKSKRSAIGISPKLPANSSPVTIQADDAPQCRLEPPRAPVDISDDNANYYIPKANSSEGGVHGNVESPGILSPHSPTQNHLNVDYDARSYRKSLASNIFDDEDSLSAGIREYVQSKIAEAFHQHSCDCPIHTPFNVTANFELKNSDGIFFSSSYQRSSPDTNLLHGPKRLGPIVLTYSPKTYKLQKGIIATYLLIIAFSAFIGPHTFFVTIWRLSAALITYLAIARFMGWYKIAHTDLLLAPVAYAAVILRNFICDAIDQYTVFKVHLNSRIMRESLVEMGAVFQPK